MENNTDSLNTDLLKNMKEVMSFVEKSGQVSAIPRCNSAAVNTFPVCMKNLETECQAYLLPIPASIQKKEEIILKRVDIFIHIAQSPLIRNSQLKSSFLSLSSEEYEHQGPQPIFHDVRINQNFCKFMLLGLRENKMTIPHCLQISIIPFPILYIPFVSRLLLAVISTCVTLGAS